MQLFNAHKSGLIIELLQIGIAFGRVIGTEIQPKGLIVYIHMWLLMSNLGVNAEPNLLLQRFSNKTGVLHLGNLV